MSRDNARKGAQYSAVVLFALIGGFALWHWGAPNAGHIIEKTERERSAARPVPIPMDRLGDASRVALHYARAVRDGRCDDVIAVTWWMQERLRYVEQDPGGAGELAKARDALCSELARRAQHENEIGVDGIEDRYLFQPGVTIEPVEVDEGRLDLAKSVANRTWLYLEYDRQSQAPRDVEGEPIRSLVVGVNVSTDGYVLKAGVIGNVEINWDSISRYWQ